MKLRHLLTGTILTVNTCKRTAVTALAAASKGSFETVDTPTISWLELTTASPLMVRIFKRTVKSIKIKNTGGGSIFPEG